MKKTILAILVSLLNFSVLAQENVVIEQNTLEVNSAQINMFDIVDEGSFEQSGVIKTYDKISVSADMNMSVCTREELDGTGRVGYVFMTIRKVQSVVVLRKEISGIIDFIERFILDEPVQTSLGRNVFYETIKGMTISYTTDYVKISRDGKPVGLEAKEIVIYFDKYERPIKIKFSKKSMQLFRDGLNEALNLLDKELAPLQRL